MGDFGLKLPAGVSLAWGPWTKDEVERGEHWLYADVTCPHCGKVQPVAVTHYVGGPCCECGRPTGVGQERDRRG